MDALLHRFGSLIKGCLTGFDRIVFKGGIRPIMFAAGMQQLLATQGVLNKHYKDWALAQSAAIVAAADQYAQATCGRPITYLPSSQERKEALAHARQQETGIATGLIGVWACVEACTTFRSTFDRDRGIPQLRTDHSRCKHLYFYYDHADYGFMSIRLQTWAPFGIQIALNGREWLRRGLQQAGCPYLVQGNKFLHLDDYALAQRLLDQQLDTRWADLLAGLLPQVFPTMAATLGEGRSYYWTLWQSEWATDYLFENPAAVRPLMEALLRHALLTGTADRVLRYLGRPVTAAGQPHPLANPDLLTRVTQWQDGLRIRHWVDRNSVKLYNEQNVVRVEQTMNNPKAYRVHRYQEGETAPTTKQRLPLRQGVADIPLRAQIAGDITRRFTDQLATVRDTTPVRDLVQDVTTPLLRDGRRSRALDLLGKDRALLQAIADPKYAVSGLTNTALQQALGGTPWAHGLTGRSLSARISRHLRLLRDHGLIRKLPKQRRYHLTGKGRKITTAVNVLLGASTEQLLEKAA